MTEPLGPHEPFSTAGIVAYCREQFPRKRNYKKPIERFFNRLCFTDDCWLWFGSLDGGGYGIVSPSMGTTRAHRLSWILHNGPIPDGLDVCHKCDVRNCVNPEHLFLGTALDNMRDMIAKGRKSKNGPKGEFNARSVLTKEKVLEMRALRAQTGESHKLLAKRFGVTTMTAWRACTGQCWGHV